jgi:hypothetical protein
MPDDDIMADVQLLATRLDAVLILKAAKGRFNGSK